MRGLSFAGGRRRPADSFSAAGRARGDLLDLFRNHDVVVSPSLWECWPNVVLEALSQNKPVLATPVGGQVELVRPGRAGWLAKDADENGLTVAFERLLDSRDEIQALVDSSGPRRHFEELTDTESVRTSYEDLAGRAAKAGRRRRSSERPLVSVVVPYFELSAYVEETIDSIFEQTYPRLEVVIVNDGSFWA